MILVTGAAGFIGYHVTRKLLERGDVVVGIDNLNDYYDVQLKHARLAHLTSFKEFTFLKTDITDREAMSSAFMSRPIRSVVHLAAQAGVRYSLINPYAYSETNISGFLNILENCRRAKIQHLIFASSSSVYGGNTRMPFSVHDNVDHPVSLYAATKKANELMAHSYAHLFAIPCSGLRFFTVYGPWGRPDMALFLFTKAILEGRPIDVYNFGDMRRDFTYIDDIAEGVVRVHDKPASSNANWSGQDPDPGTSSSPYRIYNIGNHRPVELSYIISLLEKALGTTALKNLLPMQPGDVPATYAEVDHLIREVGFKPDTPIEIGIQRFVDWYLSYYQQN